MSQLQCVYIHESKVEYTNYTTHNPNIASRNEMKKIGKFNKNFNENLNFNLLFKKKKTYVNTYLLLVY